MGSLKFFLAITLANSAAFAQCSERDQKAEPVTALVLDAARSTFETSTPVSVSLTITNKSDNDVSLFREAHDFDNRLEVLESSGKPGRETRLGYRQSGHADPNSLNPNELAVKFGCLTLKAHESLILRLDISSLYDLSQPGKYTV